MKIHISASGAYELLRVMEEYEIQFHDNSNYVMTFEILIDFIPVLM